MIKWVIRGARYSLISDGLIIAFKAITGAIATPSGVHRPAYDTEIIPVEVPIQRLKAVIVLRAE